MKLTQDCRDYKDITELKEAVCTYLADAKIANTRQIMKVLERDRNHVRGLDGLVKKGYLKNSKIEGWHYKTQEGVTAGRVPKIWQLTPQGVAYCQTTLGLKDAKECNKQGEAIKGEIAKEDVRIGLRKLGFWPHREQRFRGGKQLVIPDNAVEDGSKIVWVETESNSGGYAARIKDKVEHWCNFFRHDHDPAIDNRIRVIFLWQAPDQDIATTEYQRAMTIWSRTVRDVCKRQGLDKAPFELGFYAHSSFMDLPTIDWSAYQLLPDLQQLAAVSSNEQIDEATPPSTDSLIARFRAFGEIYDPMHRKALEYVRFLGTWLNEEYALRIILTNAVTRTKLGSAYQLQKIATAFLSWMGYVGFPRPDLGDADLTVFTHSVPSSLDIAINFTSMQSDDRLWTINKGVCTKKNQTLDELVSAIAYLLFVYSPELGLQQGSSLGRIKLNLRAPKTDSQLDNGDRSELAGIDASSPSYFNPFPETGTDTNINE